MNPYTMEHIILAEELNEFCIQLNELNDAYPRSCGSIVMASWDTENRIESLVNQIDSHRARLSDLTDADLAEITEDVPYYRSWLQQVAKQVSLNRDAIARSRQFLSKYMAC